MRVDCLYLLLILLLPLLPAFVLFRFLPASADVQGPFKGLTIKLGGAFAGYFLTVLLSWQVAASLLAPTWSDNWNVVAHIRFNDAEHRSPSEATVIVNPPIPSIDPGGQLRMKIPISRDHNGPVDVPTLIIAFNGYETVSVPLDPDKMHLGSYGGQDYGVEFDEKTRQIFVGKPIVLTKITQ
jgi:hypothetical protein